MNKISSFSLVLVALIISSCGSQIDYAELQTSGTERLRSQAEEFFNNKEYDKAIDAYEILLTKTENPKSKDYFTLGKCYYIANELKNADSVFTLLIERNPELSVGYLWRARTKARIDSVYNDFSAKSDFGKIIEIGASDPKKSERNLIEAYKYLAYYYYSKSEFKRARDCVEQIIKIENDPRSIETYRIVLKTLDGMEK